MQKPGVTKCGKMALQSVLGWWITKRDKMDYKVRQGLQSVAGLQNELVHGIPYPIQFLQIVTFPSNCIFL